MFISPAIILTLATLALAIPAPEPEFGDVVLKEISERSPSSSSLGGERGCFPTGQFCYKDSDCCSSDCSPMFAFWPWGLRRCSSSQSVPSSTGTAAHSTTSQARPTPSTTGHVTTSTDTSQRFPASDSVSASSTTPCQPSTYTNTITRVYRTIVRGVPTTITERQTVPATYDPPCAFSNPSGNSVSATFTGASTTSHASSSPSLTMHSSIPSDCFTETYVYFQYSEYTSTMGKTTERGISIHPATGTNTFCPQSDRSRISYPPSHTSGPPSSISSHAQCFASTKTITFTDTFTSPYHTYTFTAIADPPCAFGSHSTSLTPSFNGTLTSTQSPPATTAPGPPGPNQSTQAPTLSSTTALNSSSSTVSEASTRSYISTTSGSSTTTQCQPVTESYNLTITLSSISAQTTLYSTITSAETSVIYPDCTTISQQEPRTVSFTATSSM